MTRSRPALVTLMSVAVFASGCATTPDRAPPAGPKPAARPSGSSDAMVSGEGGLAIAGQTTPAALQGLVAAPYALPSPPDCAAMARDIATLDGILGPDVDAVAASRNAASDAFGSAVRGVMPYRWVMRLMTGASRRDRELRLAVLAGTARRAYLKGLRQGLACQPPQAAPR